MGFFFKNFLKKILRENIEFSRIFYFFEIKNSKLIN